MQFQIYTGRGSTIIFCHKRVTQSFSILKTEKAPSKILKKPKNEFFTKKRWHIITNYDSQYMQMGGHFAILDPQ